MNNIEVHSPAAAAAAVQARFLMVTSSATDSIAFIHKGNEEIRRPTASLSLSLSLALGYGDGHRKQSALLFAHYDESESFAGRENVGKVQSNRRFACCVM
jgi:hypothetical protein